MYREYGKSSFLPVHRHATYAVHRTGYVVKLIPLVFAGVTDTKEGASWSGTKKLLLLSLQLVASKADNNNSPWDIFENKCAFINYLLYS